jgi:hypothetical protein
MADLPLVQAANQGTQIQEARPFHGHHSLLVSALPLPPEHLQYLQGIRKKRFENPDIILRMGGLSAVWA